MADWPTTYWLIGCALVVLIFGSAWMGVRVLRARHPVPGAHAEEDHERPSTDRTAEKK